MVKGLSYETNTPYSIKLDHTSQFAYFTSGLVAVGCSFSTKGAWKVVVVRIRQMVALGSVSEHSLLCDFSGTGIGVAKKY